MESGLAEVRDFCPANDRLPPWVKSRCPLREHATSSYPPTPIVNTHGVCANALHLSAAMRRWNPQPIGLAEAACPHPIKSAVGSCQRSRSEALAQNRNSRRNDAPRGLCGHFEGGRDNSPWSEHLQAQHRTSIALAWEFRMSDDISRNPCCRPSRRRFGAVMSMQVATILASTEETKTVTPS
jgi:hypothetical protein